MTTTRLWVGLFVFVLLVVLAEIGTRSVTLTVQDGVGGADGVEDPPHGVVDHLEHAVMIADRIGFV